MEVSKARFDAVLRRLAQSGPVKRKPLKKRKTKRQR